MNACVLCKHWDEESTEDNSEGIGLCLLKTGWFGNPRHFAILRTRGDSSCDKYEPKMTLNDASK